MLRRRRRRPRPTVHTRLFEDCLITIKHELHTTDSWNIRYEFMDQTLTVTEVDGRGKFPCPLCQSDDTFYRRHRSLRSDINRQIFLSEPFRRGREERRARLIQRDGNRCKNCSAPAHETTLSVDHITPVSFGGALIDISNLQLLCLSCNQDKRLREEDRRKIADRLNACNHPHFSGLRRAG